MTLRTYIDRAIHDGTDFDAVISGCDVQQTFCWQPDMCITDACEAEYRALLDAEVRVLAAAPGERFSIIEICTDRLFLGDAMIMEARPMTMVPVPIPTSPYLCICATRAPERATKPLAITRPMIFIISVLPP